MGRIQVAYGIIFQHRGNFSDAKIMLNAGLESLPGSHPDRLNALAHFAAASMKSKDCPCGDEEKTLNFGFRGL
ncbi:MAG: hypothetical protein P1Q69_17920, partial [Candidatus Thorarchaeota archaeon]|nr:hypothetical protein [Candidatus Thorarchaeota archaeon]